MSNKLLVVSDNAGDLEFAKAAAETSGLEVQKEANPERAAEIIRDENVRVIFVDCADEATFFKFEAAIRDKVGLFSDKINANSMHYLSSQDLQNIQGIFQSPIFGHYIFRNFGDPPTAGRRYGQILKATLLDRSFGLQHFFPEATKVQRVVFEHSLKKQEGVEAVKNYLLAANFKTRMATVIANAVDELLMNAMYDAPVDAMGKALYVATPRNTPIDLKDKHAVEMHVAFDKDYVAVTAVDHFGSLDKVKLFSHMSKRYIEEEYKVKTSVAGAGIGLATVFRSGGSFCFASEAGVKTEVTVFFKRTDNFREFKDQFRFISTQFYF
ncbi:MAG: hypothetical protein AB7P04_04010 [Bacteriovoracia bacterium]